MSTFFEKFSDSELVQKCQASLRPDRQAFSELMRRYTSHVAQVLYDLAPDWDDRADLAQEVWIRVFRNIKRLEKPEEFRSWVGRITTNLLYDELYKRKREVSPNSVLLDEVKFIEKSSEGSEKVAKHLVLNIDIHNDSPTDEVALELSNLCKAINAYHIACGGSGLTIDEWNLLVRSLQPVRV
jgi:RNA polymerase sigma factor (sigma-70 family)